MISGPFRWMKWTRLSAATARASSVFPVPGGPYSSTPFGARMPSRWKSGPCFSGSSTISRTRATSRSSPPMSSYDTAGARASAGSPSTTRRSVRGPMTTTPDGIVRTTEVHRLGERRHADRGAVDDRHALEIVEHALDGDAGRRGAGRKRRQPDGNGVPRFDARRRHLFLEPRAAIAAERAVDLHEAFVRGAAALGARDGDRPPSDLERVAGPAADPLEIARRQPGDGPRDVLDARLGDAQRDRGGGGGRFGHDAPPHWRRTCCAKRSNSAPSCGTAVRRSSGAIATRVASLPRSVMAIVPRFVCSIAQPSAFTEVTAMLRAAASLSQGTTSALMPCARASSSMARETRDGDPAAVNSASMARCGTLARWSNRLERGV